MPFERKQPAVDAAGDPRPFRGRRRLRHLDDQVLDGLLEQEPDPDLVAAAADHASGCLECHKRLEEWTTLFPQLESVLPEVEEPGASFLPSDLPRVMIPDNEPPRPPAASHRLAWSVAMVLLVAVVVLAWQLLRTEDESVDPFAVATPAASRPVDLAQEVEDSTVPEPASAAEMLTSPAVVVMGSDSVPEDITDEESAAPDQTLGLAAGMTDRSSEDEPRQEIEETSEPETTFPRRQPPRSFGSALRPGQPYEAVPDEPPGMSSRKVAQLPATFIRTTAPEAAEALGSRMRVVGGLSPDQISLAPGRIIPAARRNKVMVRQEYTTPRGTHMILDQQWLGSEFASPEPSIAVSTSKTGVSVAQWIDHAGYSMSLAGRLTQRELLRYANLVR